MLPKSYLNRQLQIMKNLEIPLNCMPKKKALNQIRNNLSDNKSFTPNYSGLKNCFYTDNYNRIKKDYEFSNIKETKSNNINNLFSKSLILDGNSNKNRISLSQLKEPLIYEDKKKVLISTLSEYNNINNESHYENKLNNFSKVAHEFKTPLNAIIGLITEIKNNPINISKVLSNIDIINNLSNYLIFLITDITQFINQNTKSNIVVITETLFLKSIIEFCFEILNSLLICKNAKINIETEIIFDNRLDAIEITSNEMRIKQILLNFISNSVKFTKSGYIKIKTELKSKNNCKYVKMSVIDTGVGIREDDQKKIFNEIYTDMRKESNNYGSGLGLSICKFISEKLNHSLKFKSKYGEGSKFSLIIPECCLKIDEKNLKNINNNTEEFTNIRIYADKTKNIILNSKIKDFEIKQKDKDDLILKFNTDHNKRRMSYDDNLSLKNVITFKEYIFDVQKTKTFREISNKNIYNNLFDSDYNNEGITVRNEEPLIFKYSFRINKNSSDDISPKTQICKTKTYNSSSNLLKHIEIENFSNSFDKQNNYPYYGQTILLNGISSIGIVDYK